MEAVGLGIGVAGLAGLFSACIDCFELIQRGRYHGKDFLLLETKFTNQRLRLKTWGRACGFLNPGADDDDNDAFDDAEVRASIATTLAHLLALFRDGRGLTTKYGLKRDQDLRGLQAIGSGRIGAMVSDRLSSSRLGQRLQELGENVYKTQKEAKVTTKARWAVEDKAKFAELVQHLKDLIDDLEGLTRWMPVADRQQQIIRWEVESITDIETLEIMEGARVGRLDMVSDAASIRLWELRDRYLEDGSGPQRSMAARRSSSTSTVSLEDGWHDIGQDTSTRSESTGDECYCVLHKVICLHAYLHTTTNIYLDAPSYAKGTVLDDENPTADPVESHLCGQRVIHDLEAFLAQNYSVSFVVLKNYSCRHGVEREGDPNPQVFTELIYLWSQELGSALAVALRSSLLPQQRPILTTGTELKAPYLWLYQSRDALDIMRYSGHPATPIHRDLMILLERISMMMSNEYSHVTALTEKGLITWDYLPYIFAPGRTVVETNDKGREHYLAYTISSVKFKNEDDGRPSMNLILRNYVFDGTLKITEPTWKFSRPFVASTNDTRFSISSMLIHPLDHAPGDLREYFLRRGQTYWACRHTQLANYAGPDAPSTRNFASTKQRFPILSLIASFQSDRRFMIDTALHYKLYPESRPKYNFPPEDQQNDTDGDFKEIPDESVMLLLPPTLYGYDLNEQEWSELLVSNVTPVTWNKEALDHIILPAQDKDLILAMASSYEVNDSRAGDRKRLGRGGFLLLHGGPGTGKTSTAEAIAETTERPLVRISLSNIGSDPAVAQKHLRTVAVMCNAWDCVVLLSGAGIFFEQRRQDSVSQNVMAVAITEALDTFTCMMVFTTDRVGTFDETFRSRCQLAVHLERPDCAARKKIWRNFLDKVECEMKDGDLLNDLETFARWEMNGMQIRNAITMATQLAYAKEESLSAKHVHVVFNNSRKFEKYLTDHHGVVSEED